MAEKITAYSMDLRPHVMNRTGRVLFGAGEAGQTEPKYEVATNKGAYIERPFPPNMGHTINILEQAGIPIPQGILINPGRKYMLVPDLTADGSELYGSNLLSSLFLIDETRRNPKPDIDAKFLEITAPHKFFRIRTAATRIFQTADTFGIEMPYDDPLELRVRPSGRWQFVCLDLDQAITDPIRSESDRAYRRERNAESLEHVLSNIEMMRFALLDA